MKVQRSSFLETIDLSKDDSFDKNSTHWMTKAFYHSIALYASI